MEDKNKPILDELIKNAFPQVRFSSYKITQYSLNTKFSFKFDSLAHFTNFIHQHQSLSEKNRELLRQLIQDSNIEPDSFFTLIFLRIQLKKNFSLIK